MSEQTAAACANRPLAFGGSNRQEVSAKSLTA
jgi:hypothetical protein